MSDKFELLGRSMEDSALYPWAVGSIGRALLFYGHAVSARDNRVLSSIAAYYSLFHLSMFILCLTPHLLSPSQRRRINNALRQGQRDPSPQISHRMIDSFLDLCAGNGLPGTFPSVVREARQLREFANYGPRVTYKPDEIFIYSSEFPPAAVTRIVNQLHSLFRDVVLWLCVASVDGGIWVPIALEQAGKFFAMSGPPYKDWVPSRVHRRADQLRVALHRAVSRALYPKRTSNNRLKRPG